MKVLIAATHLDKGGIAFYTVNLARQLKAFGAEPVVLSSGGFLTKTLDSEGIPHIEAPIRTKSEFGLKMWGALPGVMRKVREGGFDIIHAQTRVTQVMSEIILRITGIPYVTTCHGFFKHQRLSRRILPCWGERVIAISKSVEKHLVSDMKVSQEKVEMVYNGIDLGSYTSGGDHLRTEVLGELGINTHSVVIGSVGRFSTVKGFRYLVEAFDMAASETRNISLMIIGEGPEEDALRVQAAAAEAADRIFLIKGKRPLVEYLSAMDIFCMPSINEGFGLAVAEAMASGKPCLVSRVGGLTEIVTDGKDGIVFSPGSPEELSKAIIRLAGDPELRKRLSEEARTRALDFSLEKSAEGTVKVYERVLAARRRHDKLKGK